MYSEGKIFLLLPKLIVIVGVEEIKLSYLQINKTQLLTNQLGYVMRDEHEGFDWERWVEV